MKRELQVGDRVAVYGTLNGGVMLDGQRGTIVTNDYTHGPPEGWITVDFEGRHNLQHKHVHPKQCRRLIRRERREWRGCWRVLYGNDGMGKMAFVLDDTAKQPKPPPAGECAVLIEARPRKAGRG